jgi:hypothetical protein
MEGYVLVFSLETKEEGLKTKKGFCAGFGIAVSSLYPYSVPHPTMNFLTVLRKICKLKDYNGGARKQRDVTSADFVPATPPGDGPALLITLCDL